MEKIFIKHGGYPNDGGIYAPTICFKKKFTANSGGSFTLFVSLLGFGYVYINGKAIADDLFLSPVSDYRKTLWVNEYDVTYLLKEGENEIFVELGNGFYNEGNETVWGHHKAAWRGEPTFCLSIEQDGKEIVRADESWSATLSKRTVFNELRSGEYFDSRIKEETGWGKAVLNYTPPMGKFTRCDCPPILEQKRLAPVVVLKNANGYLFDFGKNVAGYAEICVTEEEGREITMRFAEEIDENGELKLNGLNCYQKMPFQTDKLVCNGKEVVFKPRFTYHGFRYVEVVGLTKEPSDGLLTAISIYQNIEKHADFSCSDETINKIYKAGIASTRANTFYSFTDCPTREKLGWTNDSQASLEQILFNFDGEKLLEKWLVDIFDAMTQDGDLPGIVPSPDWGYGHGPICNAIIFILPYALYKYCGNKTVLQKAFPYMKRYNEYLLKNKENFHLGDWTGTDFMPTPKAFIAQTYLFIFSKIFREMGEDFSRQETSAKSELEKYIQNGRCTIEEQSAVAALLMLGIGDGKILGEQLVELIENTERHIACGMFGVQFLYKALIKIGRVDLAYDMITNETAPSFKNWMDRGATTLWETFDENAGSISKNHHMFSNVLYFFIEGLCGLKRIGENEYLLTPQFIQALSFVKCNRKTKEGSFSVSWERVAQSVQLTVCTTGNVSIKYHGKEILGEEIFIERQVDGK